MLGNGSSSQITGSVGTPIRVNSVYARESSGAFAFVSSVAGYKPTASNRYFADASCPIFATSITLVAIALAELPTRLLMFSRTRTMSTGFFVLPVLFFADFFATLLLLPLAFFFFFMTMVPPRKTVGVIPISGFTRASQLIQ